MMAVVLPSLEWKTHWKMVTYCNTWLGHTLPVWKNISQGLCVGVSEHLNKYFKNAINFLLTLRVFFYELLLNPTHLLEMFQVRVVHTANLI